MASNVNLFVLQDQACAFLLVMCVLVDGKERTTDRARASLSLYTPETLVQRSVRTTLSAN